MNDFKSNRKLEADYAPILDELLIRHCASHILRGKFAGWDKDLKESTDRIYEVSNGGSVAQRVRRYSSTGDHFRDLTLRRVPRSRGDTEWHKIRAGACRWYHYAWLDRNGDVGDWMFIDLDALRSTHLLEWAQSTLTPNKYDETMFYWIPANVMINYYSGIVLEHNMDFKMLYNQNRRRLPSFSVMRMFRDKAHAWKNTPDTSVLSSIASEHGICPICLRERPTSARVTCTDRLCMMAYTVGV